MAAILTVLLTLACGLSRSPVLAAGNLGLAPHQIKNLVTFGDSYTDVVAISDGGTPWPVYAASYAGVRLLPFARSGAPCSQALTPRPFPAVVQDELPAYFAELRNGTLGALPPAETLYTLWIGTNDLGPNTLLTGQVRDGADVVAVTACAVGWVQTLYDAGARNFLFQNLVPLDRLPLYAVDSYPNRYWTAQRNTTEWHLFMSELTAAGNALSRLMLQALAPSLPGAHVGLFDSHALFSDILDRPAAYLNGTAPLNTTGAVDACVYALGGDASTARCTVATGSARDSFVWYDELHPSEQSDRIVAREIANTLAGKGSRWTTWFS